MPTVNQELLSSANYALLAYAGITNTGSTVISGGNVGSAPTSSYTPGGWTLVPPTIIDTAHAAQARIDGNAALLYYQSLGPGTVLTTADMGTQNGGGGVGHYYAGVFSSATSLAITTAIILDGQGNPNATFVFLAASTVTQQIAGTITLIGGAQANNVIWVPGSSWTSIGPGAVTIGNIIAYTSVTLGGGTFQGRALAVGGGNGAVTIGAAENIQVPASSIGAGMAKSYSAQSAHIDHAPAAFYSVQSTDWGSVQLALPTVGADTGVDFYVIASNRFKPQWRTVYVRPQGISDPASVGVSGHPDCIAPVWASGATITSYNGGSPADTSFTVINGVLFGATTGGTTGATFPANLNFTVGSTTTDNSVVWTCLGYRGLIKIRFENTSATPGAPAAQEYDFFQE